MSTDCALSKQASASQALPKSLRHRVLFSSCACEARVPMLLAPGVGRDAAALGSLHRFGRRWPAALIRSMNSTIPALHFPRRSLRPSSSFCVLRKHGPNPVEVSWVLALLGALCTGPPDNWKCMADRHEPSFAFAVPFWPHILVETPDPCSPLSLCRLL